MKHFVDRNLANATLARKAHEIGFDEVGSLLKVIEAPTSDQLISQCKRGNSPGVVNPLSASDFFKSSGLIEIAREKQKTFEIPIVYLLRAGDRSKLIFQLRIFLKNCVKRKVQFFFSTRATSELELKSPREIIAIGQVLGLTYEQAAASISEVDVQ